VTSPIEPIALRNRPYAERQIITVVDDAVVKAAREAESKAMSRPSGALDWTALAKVAVDSLSFTAAGTVVLVVAESAIKMWAKAKQCGVDVVQVARSEAATLLFPPGHPRDGVLYIGHPAMPTAYYTAASFHRLTFEHKFAEAVELLMHLGAAQLKVEHLKGWSREFSSRLAVSLPQVAEVGGEAQGSAHSTASLLFEANLRGTAEPALPRDLIWYPHEPTWQAIAKGRLQFGLQEFSLVVNYDDDFGVNAGLKMSAQKAGFDLGGNFEDHESTTWKLVGKFGKDSA
jgi:hypothetical protein